ncbi:hypothetical protein Syun_007131 [Stephania yunnanensis]|uniref:Uncharacterized protein n=1 Tax=Stephania yunnanensis TaxID=152371 RepID=A0AAP0KYZ9_9MAGN
MFPSQFHEKEQVNFDKVPKFDVGGEDFIEDIVAFGDDDLVIEVISQSKSPRGLETVVDDCVVNNYLIEKGVETKVKFAATKHFCSLTNNMDEELVMNTLQDVHSDVFVENFRLIVEVQDIVPQIFVPSSSVELVNISCVDKFITDYKSCEEGEGEWEVTGLKKKKEDATSLKEKEKEVTCLKEKEVTGLKENEKVFFKKWLRCSLHVRKIEVFRPITRGHMALSHHTHNRAHSSRLIRRPQTTSRQSASPMALRLVRKEKLGDRITALQQLVSPFGKQIPNAPRNTRIPRLHLNLTLFRRYQLGGRDKESSRSRGRRKHPSLWGVSKSKPNTFVASAHHLLHGSAPPKPSIIFVLRHCASPPAARRRISHSVSFLLASGCSSSLRTPSRSSPSSSSATASRLRLLVVAFDYATSGLLLGLSTSPRTPVASLPRGARPIARPFSSPALPLLSLASASSSPGGGRTYDAKKSLDEWRNAKSNSNRVMQLSLERRMHNHPADRRHCRRRCSHHIRHKVPLT